MADGFGIAMAEVEFAGLKFKGGKIFVIITALTTLGGGLWGGFEFYKDYMDMKEIIQNIDTNEIEAKNKQLQIKLDDAIDYTRDIKNGLKDDIVMIEKQVDRLEDKLQNAQDDGRKMIQNAEERFENKRDAYKEKESQVKEKKNKK